MKFEYFSKNQPIIIAFTVVLISSILKAFFFYEASIKMSFYEDAFTVFMNKFMSFGTLVTVFIYWISFTVLPHFIALLFDGEGKFKNLLAMTGYGFAFMGIFSLINLFLLDMIEMPFPIPENFKDENIYLKTAIYLHYAAYCLIFVWIIYSVKKIHGLNYIKSATTVLGPLATSYLLSTLFSYI